MALLSILFSYWRGVGKRTNLRVALRNVDEGTLIIDSIENDVKSMDDGGGKQPLRQT